MNMNRNITIAHGSEDGPEITLDVLESRVRRARTEGVPGTAKLKVIYDPTRLADALVFTVPVDAATLTVDQLISAFRTSADEATRTSAWDELVARARA